MSHPFSRTVLAWSLAVLALGGSGGSPTEAADPPFYVKRDTWHESLLASRERLMEQETRSGKRTSLPDFGTSDFTVTLWMRTEEAGGALFAKAPREGEWVPQGKVLFLRGGAPAVDVGWVGAVPTDTAVHDGRWHHVALAGRDPLVLYVDGALVKTGRLELESDPPGHVAKIGACTSNFPSPAGFRGDIDEVRIYDRRLSNDELAALPTSVATEERGLAGYWPFEKGGKDASGNGHDGTIQGAVNVEGKAGRALRFDGDDVVILPASAGQQARADLWALLERDFTDPGARKEMAREREDGIWGEDWQPGRLSELASRYAEACRDESQKAEAAPLAESVRSAGSLWKVRKVYHTPPPLRFPEPSELDKDPHLVGWWQFDQESGKTLKDSSGQGRDGKLPEGVSADEGRERGRYGRALRLDRSRGPVKIPGYKGVTGTEPRTASFWVKTATRGGEIVSWGADEPGRMWIVGHVRGKIGVLPKGGYLYMKERVDDDTWHHIAVVVDEADPPNLHDHVTLYLDGEPAEIDDIGLLDLWPIETGDELDVTIGSGFTGLIDELRIYDRPLSEEEVVSLYRIKSRTRSE